MHRGFRHRALGSVICALGLFVTACGSAARPVVRQEARDERTGRAFDIVLAAGGARDCDAEHNRCFEQCWNNQPPYPRKRGGQSHYEYCTGKCRKEYMQCVESVGARPLAFPSLKSAMDWLSEHKSEVLVGTIVLVAGAAFVVSTGGAGALVLVPVGAAVL
ncbi:hypothetical protein P2318_32185 [Myxococcaceae bacterium GXIMD 01537]